MSDNIPFEIQLEIMKRLPVKPLLQFRSVSKAWKSMIDSSHFIAHYESQVQHLLVICTDIIPGEYRKYFSIVDDDTFPQKKVSPIVPESLKVLQCIKIVGCSNGLLCLNGERCYPDDDNDNFTYGTEVAVLWNISIRKAVGVVIPYPGSGYGNFLGFGVCSETNDPKIVNIKLACNRGTDTESVSYMPWQIEVFSLSTGAWRSVDNNFLRKSTELCLFHSQVVIDGTLYWLATDKVPIGSRYRSYSMIVSFDITKEEFREVNLADSLARHEVRGSLCIFKLRKSLVVLERNAVANNPTHIIWMLEDVISGSLTKLFNIYTPDGSISRVLGFRKNGEAVLELYDYFVNDSSLVVYEPYTNSIEKIGIGETDQEYYLSSYIETLHLHDQPDSIVYYKGKRFLFK